jgi:hypothetical protein
MPQLILRCIRSAVTLKNRSLQWFQKIRPDEELMPDNLSHSYFIRVIERVLQILEPNFCIRQSWIRRHYMLD